MAVASCRGEGPGHLIGTAVLTLACAIGAGVATAQPAPVCVPPPAGMVAWWPGDGTTSDLIGGNKGMWVGSAAYTAGEVGQAFSLNGSSWVQVPSTAGLSPTGAITIDAWINTTTTNATSRIVDKITAGGGDGYLLDLLRGRLRLLIDSTSVTGSTTLQPGVTYHVAGTYDGSTLTVYLDGVSDGTSLFSGAIPTSSLPVRIGADSSGANTFSGWIDEVEIFNRALSSTEVQAIRNAFSAGKCKPQVIPATSTLGLALLGLLVLAAGLLLLRR
ncbi:MAG: LamG domain-containing protein [Acidobacteriia bacterium]|nr:LamG domain-containing protein [Terriglobia bacterium]